MPCPCQLKRSRHGCHPGAAHGSRKRRYRPVLPSVIIVNVRSLHNKTNELTALNQHERDYRECSMIVFTETWLTALTPNTDAKLDGFRMWWTDRKKKVVRQKDEGWLCLLITDDVTVGISLLKNTSAARTLNF